MSIITDILREVPLSAVQAERLALSEQQREFDVSRLKADRDDFKAKFENCATRLEIEQKDHALTRQKLKEALDKIGRLTAQPKPVPQITVDIPKFRGMV